MTEDDSTSVSRSQRVLQGLVLVLAVLIFFPLVFQPQFRKLVGIALLGIAYSIFLVRTWRRWKRQAERLRTPTLGWVSPTVLGRGLLKLLPLRAWGVVPFFIQFFVLVVFGVCGWFLGPVIYKVLRNPATPGILREALEGGAPEFYRFLNAIASNQDPVTILRENAQQVFTSLNRFVSAISALGAALYDSIENLMKRAEGNQGSRFSTILNSYSILFWEYLVYNTLYYLILSVFVVLALGGLDFMGLTTFGWKLIAGIIVAFVAGNLIIPGLGTFTMTVFVVGILLMENGLTWALTALLVFSIYFLLDDYVIKPWFLTWVGGGRTGEEWEFGIEIIVFGLVVLYATFGLIGFLLVFPILCFLAAYLEQQHPDLRPWVLNPISNLKQ
ncbi:MAG: hypothetical protein ABEK50_07425 [bacterium]